MGRPVIERGGATTRGPIIAGFARYSGGGWTMRRDSRDERRGRPVAEDSLDAQARRDASARARLARYAKRINPDRADDQAKATAKALEAYELRQSGLTLRQVGERLGITSGAAFTRVQSAQRWLGEGADRC